MYKVKKICFVIGSLGIGGAERVIVTLANNFALQGIKISIICIGREKVESIYKLEDNIKVVDIVSGYSSNIFLRKVKQYRNMRKFVKYNKPNIIISFLDYINIQVLLVLKKMKIPIVISERSDSNVKSKMLKMLCKIIYCSANAIVFQTNEQQRFFGKRIEKLGNIILNPIREDMNVNNEIIYKDTVTNICSVGRLNKLKNYRLLIEAFEIISVKYPQIKLTIYGEGEERLLLEKIIEIKGLLDKVFMPGATEKIVEKLEKTDIFILCSNHEGLPNALIEAMCTGVPCISTKFGGGGVEMLIEDGINGLLVPTNNIDMLVNKIIKMIEDVALRRKLGQNAMKLQEKVNIEFISCQWLKLIEKIVI